ncbi:hypothetical protein FGE12_26090 [Aggregicoccus sp. 17bor-14]|uniref:hypothetical protein n=1 Tax=Myxococcaceae TaxID=31 RepID=UPI00129C1990|nr:MULTISPECIES: hypothetical protein [Myxococcaceae]MBF5045908.1 hypothetical protein [Simulacricoccus sp. 17bor-14]MRI91642.1 hypothetical protein [Aggregicoccus sp. 17bor-14]
MRAMKLMVVCGALVAGAASAQERSNEVSSPTGGQWSVGAGAGVTVFGNDPNNPNGFTPRASLEYMLSGDTALVLGGFGSFGVGWENGNSLVDGGVGLNLGVRKYLSGSGANRLSLHGLFNAGFRDAESAPSRIEFGLRGGFAVDHPLADALVLRATVDVANFGYGRNVGNGNNAVENRVGLDLFLAPAVELRFAF